MPARAREHNVAIKVGDQLIELWTRYDLDMDMLTPADSFALSIAPCDQEVFDLCEPDSEVSILLDGTKLITGYIDERNAEESRDGSSLEIQGRDKFGRLVDESMPLTAKLRDLALTDLAKRAAAPWFTSVSLSNARNRDLIRGGRQTAPARARLEPILTDVKSAPKKVRPGESRWEVLNHFLREAGYLAWSAADGSDLIIAEPNYDQEAQYRFFAPAPGSLRALEGNVISWKVSDNLGERYSQIEVLGTSKGDSENYGRAVMGLRGVAKDGSGIDGIGNAFQRRKVLFVEYPDARNKDEANRRAQTELDLRSGSSHRVEVTVAGHSQLRRPGGLPAIYAFDTMAQVEIERIGLRGRYLVTGVRMMETRDQSQITTITMVPEGAKLQV